MMTIRNDYVKISNKALRMGLSSRAFHLFVEMASHSEDFQPSMTLLERNTGMSRATLNRAIRELKTRNMIRLYKRGSGRISSQWEFISHKYWLGTTPDTRESVKRNRIKNKEKEKLKEEGAHDAHKKT